MIFRICHWCRQPFSVASEELRDGVYSLLCPACLEMALVSERDEVMEDVVVGDLS